ncbi:N-formylglutamate amidohydrolase [Sphingomonas sp. 28-62-11]|uniref:N-formylglutamate amidohydrolase n=1 Tax=Sphingomonas sp. 28-62-11 TaxID=1970432 RepID=UPI000BD67465|nr:MAG: N-formylglutamate amidohydrolase [Sphingomonas sp. 28-62-11]
MTSCAHSFDLHGLLQPVSPVVLSVPHAGRDYPGALLRAIRVPVEALRALEDRYVDHLALAARSDESLLVQRPARAWIDLNRAEHERDPKLDDGADPARQPAMSAKLRSGLGLVPRRIAAAGDIWSARLSDAAVTARIMADHRPYHDTLAALLGAARARFGVAVLLDIHSMPSLGDSADTPQIVFGDRFGKTAASRFIDRLAGEAEAAGIGHALNTPYAGGHILDRHAAPRMGIHAIQIEFDRSLYLDDGHDAPGTGFTAAAAMLRRMIAAINDEALAGLTAIAAE